MSDKNNPSGFFWGLIIGGALGSLISTKKGRKIIKELTEHGLESLENIINVDEIKQAIDENEFVQAIKGEGEEKEPPQSNKKRRFFKGLGKK